MIVVKDLPQVQGDINMLTNSCLLGKILGELLDFKVIIAKTRSDWKNLIKWEVEYIALGNDWVFFCFLNQSNKSLVWSERPQNVQRELLVLIPWRPTFIPYLEELSRADLLIRIPITPRPLNRQEVSPITTI